MQHGEKYGRYNDHADLLLRQIDGVVVSRGRRRVDGYDDQPPFFGYLPPTFDGGLLSLLRISTPGDPERERMSVGGRAEMRFMALELFEKDDPDRQHATAAEVVEKAVAAGTPFGLYLRNFALIGQIEPGGVDPAGRPQVLTVASSDDARLQSLVAAQAAQRLPFVAIENHAVDGGPFPRFIFADEDWDDGAQVLIRHAAVVIVLYLGLTQGIARELDLLREVGGQARTLIVVDENL